MWLRNNHVLVGKVGKIFQVSVSLLHPPIAAAAAAAAAPAALVGKPEATEEASHIYEWHRLDRKK
jgi:hypothetical protein